MPKRKFKTYNHKKDIIVESSSKLGLVEPGNIVRFKYSGENISDTKPLVLVLAPKLKGMLHGVNLNYLSGGDLKQLWKSVHIELNEEDTPEKLVEDNQPVVKVEIVNPSQFYSTKLKKLLKSKLGSTGGAYRTYNASNVSSLKIVGFRFQGSKYAKEWQDWSEDYRKNK